MHGLALSAAAAYFGCLSAGACAPISLSYVSIEEFSKIPADTRSSFNVVFFNEWPVGGFMVADDDEVTATQAKCKPLTHTKVLLMMMQRQKCVFPLLSSRMVWLPASARRCRYCCHCRGRECFNSTQTGLVVEVAIWLSVWFEYLTKRLNQQSKPTLRSCCYLTWNGSRCKLTLGGFSLSLSLDKIKLSLTFFGASWDFYISYRQLFEELN